MRWTIEGLEQWQRGSVLTCWHGDLFLAAALVRHLGRASEVIAPMVREYGTPRAMALFIRQLGLQLAYIPPYEAGEARRQAMATTLIPQMAAGKSAFFAADGHRAPARQPQSDPLWLAHTAAVPLLTMAFTATPALILPTWDSKILPLPFSRITVTIHAIAPETLTPTTAPASLVPFLSQ